jgi:hypothetical protein
MGRLENLIFVILYTSFCVWPRDHYMSLQRSTIGVYHALLWLPPQAPLVAKVSPIGPFYTMWAWVKSQVISHSSEQDTQLIVFLISKQAISYRIRCGTCCSGVSTPKIQFIADSSTTCRDGVNHLHHSNRCSNHRIDPHHGQITYWRMEDHISHTKTQDKLNIIKMKDLYDTQDCMAKHN